MVSWSVLVRLVAALPFWMTQIEGSDADGASQEAANESVRLIDQLSPLNQIRVFTGLFTVLVLGLVIFIVIKAGSHMVKGLSAAANRLPHDSLPQQDDWAAKPLNETPADAETTGGADDESG